MTDTVFMDDKASQIHIVSKEIFDKLKERYPNLIDRRIPERIELRTVKGYPKVFVWEK